MVVVAQFLYNQKFFKLYLKVCPHLCDWLYVWILIRKETYLWEQELTTIPLLFSTWSMALCTIHSYRNVVWITWIQDTDMSVQSKLSRGTSGVPGYNLPSRGRLSAGYYTIGTVISKGAAWVSKSLRLVFILLWFCCCCCNSGYQTQGHALPWLCASLHIFFWRRGRKKEEKGEE